MMLHIANTFFESELENACGRSLEKLWSQSPVHLQLQFLPFLYANQGDRILVSNPPPIEYEEVRARYHLPNLVQVEIDQACGADHIEPWGYSELIGRWASAHGLHYETPSWEVVKTVNSKAFSFLHSTQLPKSALLHNVQQAKDWLAHTKGQMRVLKSCFGVSGRGHYFIAPDIGELEKKISAFFQREWNHQRPVIAEPWVQRLLDFSTQWTISKDQTIAFIGATRCQSDEKGQYRSNTVGDEAAIFGTYAPFVAEHKAVVLPILHQMANLGYFGNIGIDAMVYTTPTTAAKLHPVVEINARKTMGWVALMHQKKHHPHQCIEFQYRSGFKGLLPSSLTLANGKRIEFKRNIQVLLRDSL